MPPEPMGAVPFHTESIEQEATLSGKTPGAPSDSFAPTVARIANV